MADRRVVFDFDITFANGGGVQGQEFRLDIEGDEISDAELADEIVRDLNLLMVEKVTINGKKYIDEPHKRNPEVFESGLVDLSHPIHDGMITYPGLPGPVLRTHLSREDSRAHYAEGTEFHIGAIDMVANTGTYVDAPFHRYPDGTDLAGLPLDRLVGVPGVVVDASERVVDVEVFADTETWGKAVLIRTGWDEHFGHDDYLGEHPYLTEAGARRLVEGGAALVGIDSANIDETSQGLRPAHTLLLRAGIPVVEHLARLAQLPDGPFEFFAIPAPVVGMGTFPVRAVARWG
ncbi:MAG TPA: cyclase family protein [Acidimicrobiia bacterium]|nr:cyclase family protein [Acidimicrobiia bacterium]